eukprot:gene673-410_t
MVWFLSIILALLPAFLSAKKMKIQVSAAGLVSFAQERAETHNEHRNRREQKKKHFDRKKSLMQIAMGLNKRSPSTDVTIHDGHVDPITGELEPASEAKQDPAAAASMLAASGGMPVNLPKSIYDNPLLRDMVSDGGLCSNSLGSVYAMDVCSTCDPDDCPKDFFNTKRYPECEQRIKDATFCTDAICRGWLDSYPDPYNLYAEYCCGSDFDILVWILIIVGIVLGVFLLIAAVMYLMGRKPAGGSANQAGAGVYTTSGEGMYAEEQYAGEGGEYVENADGTYTYATPGTY